MTFGACAARTDLIALVQMKHAAVRMRTLIAAALLLSAAVAQAADRTPPVLSLPPDMVVEGDSNGAIVTFNASAVDDVDGNVAVFCSPASGSRFTANVTKTVTCSATDRSLNTASGTFTVTVINRPAPRLMLPGTITVEATSPAGAVVEYVATAMDSYEGGVPIVCTPPTNSPFPIGTTTVNCTARNGSKTASGSFLVRVINVALPVLTIPGDFSVVATSSAGATVRFTATAHDEIDPFVPVTCTPPSGSTFPIGVTPVNCSATNSRMHTATGTFNVTVTTTAVPDPVLTLPNTITAEATSPAGAAVTYVATATDPIVCTPLSGSAFPIGTTAVHCSATNSAGHTTSGTFGVRVVDTTAPTLTLPGNLSAEMTSVAGASVTFTATARDIVDGNVAVSCTPPSGSTFPMGVTPVNCSATDAHANTASGSFLITVTRPRALPVLSLPSAIAAEATSSAGAKVTFNAVASDPIDGLIAVTCTPPSGSTFALGTTSVHCSATNSGAQTVSGTFDVTVVDTTPPIVTVPAPITVTATSGNTANVTFSVSANDLVDGAVAVTCTAMSGSLFHAGTTTVDCGATDAHHNRGSASFDVTVIAIDSGAHLTLPANITAEATSDGGAIVTFNATAANGFAVVCTPSSGSLFPLGTTTVNCTATKGAQSESGSFTVTVVDTTAPFFVSASANPSVLSPPNHEMVPVTVTVELSDAIGATAHIVTVLANEAVNAPGSGHTDVDWEITGPLTVNLRSERSGVNGDRIYTIVIDAMDDAGNRSTAFVDVRVTPTPMRSRVTGH